MRIILVAMLVFLIMSFSNHAHANVSEDFEKVRQYYAAGKYKKVISATDKLFKSNGLSQARRSDLLEMRGSAFNNLEDYSNALEALTTANSLASKVSLGRIRQERFYSFFNLDRMDEACDDMVFVAQNDPESAQFFGVSTINKVIKRLLKKDDHEKLYLLLSALHNGKYIGNEPFVSTDIIYIHLVREYVKRKQFQEAKSVIAGLTQYNQLVNLKNDRSFEPLWSMPEFSQLLDIRDFPARQLKNTESLLKQYPKSLEATTNVITSLRLNGRNEEAISLARAALEKLSFYDLDDRENQVFWAKNELAYALASLGRNAEANEVFEPLLQIDLRDNGSVVSQVLNYGTILVAQGNSQKALDIVKKAEGFTSSYGTLVRQYVSACALYQMGRVGEAKTLLTQMYINGDDNVSSLLSTQVCLHEYDAMAQYIVKKLADAESRPLVFGVMQECKENPLQSVYEKVFAMEIKKIRLRPEVEKAIDSVGIVLMEPVTCGNY
ncbi:MAG: hypothetical protein ABIP02_06260 [Arenimonas sp.]